MKMIATRVVTINEVSPGDIFQFLKGSGAYSRGHLLVVYAVSASSPSDVNFVTYRGVSGSYGSLEWLSAEMNADNLRYAGTVQYPDILSLE